MTTREETVTLVGQDGREVEAKVHLRSWREGNLGAWGGVGTVSADNMGITNSGEVILRMPDGREGDVIITNATLSSGDARARLELTGSDDYLSSDSAHLPMVFFITQRNGKRGNS